RKATGADLKAKRDWKRRGRKGGNYGGAIARLTAARKKTVRLGPYLRALADVYSTLQRELCTRGRRKTRWLVSRMCESWVETTAKRLVAPTLRPSGGVLTFGDAHFRVGRGGGPKKALVAAVARHFMLREFRTSKMYPGGCGGEMVDVQEGFRVRR
ncbi:unnamed protein product, partial [Phaeothamnion confervicola]